MLGIPTVLITVGPEASKTMRPPRALCPEGFVPGNSVGRPGMRGLQRQVLLKALSLLDEPARPGEIISCDFPEYSRAA